MDAVKTQPVKKLLIRNQLSSQSIWESQIYIFSLKKTIKSNF